MTVFVFVILVLLCLFVSVAIWALRRKRVTDTVLSRHDWSFAQDFEAQNYVAYVKDDCIASDATVEMIVRWRDPRVRGWDLVDVVRSPIVPDHAVYVFSETQLALRPYLLEADRFLDGSRRI